MSDATPSTSVPHSGGASAAGQPVRAHNTPRSLFHLGIGATVLLLLRLLPNRAWLIAVSVVFTAAGWGMEISRLRSKAVNDGLMRVFGSVIHPHELTRVSSSTWYVTALLGLALFLPLRAAELGVLVLAVADPAAGLIGRRFGRTRLARNRSLEGSLGFLATGFLAATVWLLVVHAAPLRPALLVAATAATAGALTELLSIRVDDNFSTPLVAAAAAAAGERLFWSI